MSDSDGDIVIIEEHILAGQLDNEHCQKNPEKILNNQQENDLIMLDAQDDMNQTIIQHSSNVILNHQSHSNDMNQILNHVKQESEEIERSNVSEVELREVNQDSSRRKDRMQDEEEMEVAKSQIVVSERGLISAYGLATLPCNNKFSKRGTGTAKTVKCIHNPNCLHTLVTPIKKQSVGIWKKSSDAIYVNFADLMLVDENLLEKRESLDFPIGMKNLGATCYMNCLLQCLFMNRHFRNGIFRFEHREQGDQPSDDVVIREEKKDFPTVIQLQLLFGHLLLSQRKWIDPSDLVQHLNLEASLQQDVQEFNRLFLSHLENQLSKSSNSSVANLVKNLFGGYLAYVTTCEACGTKSELKSPFFELSLQIKGMKSLEDSLSHFFQEETLHGPNQYYCSCCNRKQNATRSIVLDSKGLPDFLNIQLMRFVFDVSSLQKVKVKSRIQIPLTLSYEKLGCDSSDSKEYALQAIFQHKGESAYVGHYVVDVKDEESGKWFRFDDESVTNVEIGEVPQNADIEILEAENTTLSSNAYMLVYKRVNCSEITQTFEDETPEWIKNTLSLSNEELERQIQLHYHQKKILDQFVDIRKASVKLFLNKLDDLTSSETKFNDSFCSYDTIQAMRVVPREWMKNWLYGTSFEDKSNDNGSKEKSPSMGKMEAELDSFDETKVDLTHPGKIDFTSYLCEHKLLAPKCMPDMKLVPEECWGLMNWLDSGPKLVDMLCHVCALEILSGKKEQEEVSELAEQIILELKNEAFPETSVWLSKSWISKLRKCVSSRKGYDLLFVPEEDSIIIDLEEPFKQLISSAMADVQCNHGQLSIESKKRRLVPSTTIQKIFDFLQKCMETTPWPIEEFEKSCLTGLSHTCQVCSEELEAKQKLQIEKEEELSQLKVLFSRKSSESFPDILVTPSPGTFFIIPYGWFSNWKSYLGNLHHIERPKGFAFDSLICPHSLLYFNPVPVDMESNETDGCPPGVMVLVKQSEWETLSEHYPDQRGQIAEIEVTYSKRIDLDSTKNLSTCWEDLAVETKPAICMPCITERMILKKNAQSNFQNAELTVQVISSEPLSTGNLNTGRRSKRARVGGRQKSCKVEVSSSDSLFLLKMKIMEQLDINPIAQRLFVGSTEIGVEGRDSHDKTLQQLGILNDSTIQVLKVSDKDDDDDALLMSQIAKMESQERKDEPEIGFRGTALYS